MGNSMEFGSHEIVRQILLEQAYMITPERSAELLEKNKSTRNVLRRIWITL